jgi:hypothetical protein
MTTTTDSHHEETVEIKLQSMEMRLLIRRRVTTFAIVVLALLVGSGVTRAQNGQQLDKATNSMPNGSKQSQANGLQDEIAMMLRAYYDSWTKLDATAVNSNFADDGFLTEDGKLTSSSVLKSRIRMDCASTAANDNYHFDVEDLTVFQPDVGTAVTNYRLNSRPTDKPRHVYPGYY